MSVISLSVSARHASRVRNVVVAVMSVTALSLAATNVQAHTVYPQVAVSLAGLDLAKPADAKEAYSRLRWAAKEVCPVLLSTDMRARQRHARCYSAALANAVATVNNAGLTALLDSDRTVRIAQRSVKNSVGG